MREQLRQLADDDARSMSEVVREALARYLRDRDDGPRQQRLVA